MSTVPHPQIPLPGQHASPLEDAWVALDLETTGLSNDSDEIIEVGAVKFQGDREIETYQSLIDWFPKSRYVDQAQFMVGYIHDLAGRKDSAVKAYQMVIDRYPNSVLVDDATISVRNINKPVEAWIDSVTS